MKGLRLRGVRQVVLQTLRRTEHRDRHFLDSVGRKARRRGDGELAAEAITDAAHRLEKVLVARGLERLAEPPDMHVDRALLDVDVVAPDLVEQLRAAVHT